jgi:predicted O-methyltransferase YrrM
MYKHTNNWFLTSTLKKWLVGHPVETPCQVLEIGSYEGMSSTYLCDTLCNHKDSKMYCIDPFVNNTKDLFNHNTKLSKNYDRLTLYEMTSDEFFKDNTIDFDFIYIDGDHSIPALKRDLKNSWIHLSVGGTLWFDDYMGGSGLSIKRAVDEVICNWDYDYIHVGYQLAIKKK